MEENLISKSVVSTVVGRIRDGIRREIAESERYLPDDGRERGKAARKKVTRTALGNWELKKNRTDKVNLIFEQEKSRVQDLIPVRHERMSASAFSFYRATDVIMASDLGSMPNTGIYVQDCGDAHISNFGIFASPERHLVFDINDFDETLPAPWEWDVKRMMASIEVCGRDRNFSEETKTMALREAADIYRESMREYSSRSALDVWYDHLDMETLQRSHPENITEMSQALLRKTMQKALEKNSQKAITKYTEKINGQLRFRSDPPTIVPVRDMIGENNWTCRRINL